jgi:hypothetical protein
VRSFALVAVAVRVDELPALIVVGLAAKVTVGLAAEPLKIEHPVNRTASEAGKIMDKARRMDKGIDACAKGLSLEAPWMLTEIRTPEFGLSFPKEMRKTRTRTAGRPQSSGRLAMS